MGSLQQERAARNQSTFREVNERIKEITQTHDEQRAEILCECSDVTCSTRIEIGLGEYDDVRSHGNRFVILKEHADLDVERIVAENDRFCVVEKIGRGAELAFELDPRA